MGSQQNDGMSFPPSELKPCVNNCSFFGTAGNNNLCSKCYRDLCAQEERAASAKATVEKTRIRPVTEAVPLVEPAEPPSPWEAAPEPSKAANRCGSCNKKVGLTGFVCKCGATFCGTHRYPEKHECSYDFKAAGRDVISKANPVIKADKMQRF